MNAYKSYMNKITLDPVLKDKIIKGEMKMPISGTKRRSRFALAVLRSRTSALANPRAVSRSVQKHNNLLPLVGIAACAAVFVFVIWMLPRTFINPPVPNGEHGFVEPCIPTDPHSAYIPPHEQQNENNGNLPQSPIDPFIPIYALTFNTADSIMSASRILPRSGYFNYDLTEEQLEAIFPEIEDMLRQRSVNGALGLREYIYSQTFNAVAFYRPDGFLEYVSVGESVITHDRRVLWMALEAGTSDIPESTMLLYDKEETVTSTVHHVDVTAFVHISPWDDVFLRADFVLEHAHLDEVFYRVTLSGYSLNEGKERLTEIVNWLVVAGPADLSVLADPIIPELRNEQLTLDQARLDPDFGAFLPLNIPDGFEFSSASRLLDTRVNYLLVHFNHDVPWQFSHTVRWMAATPVAHDLRNIVSVNDRQKFDVSLYTVPWMDSVPHEYFYYFQNPVFLANEITVGAIQARTRWVDTEWGNAAEWRTDQFSVLFENVIVQISANGLSAEQIWEMLSEIKIR